MLRDESCYLLAPAVMICLVAVRRYMLFPHTLLVLCRAHLAFLSRPGTGVYICQAMSQSPLSIGFEDLTISSTADFDRRNDQGVEKGSRESSSKQQRTSPSLPLTGSWSCRSGRDSWRVWMKNVRSVCELRDAP